MAAAHPLDTIGAQALQLLPDFGAPMRVSSSLGVAGDGAVQVVEADGAGAGGKLGRHDRPPCFASIGGVIGSGHGHHQPPARDPQCVKMASDAAGRQPVGVVRPEGDQHRCVVGALGATRRPQPARCGPVGPVEGEARGAALVAELNAAPVAGRMACEDALFAETAKNLGR